MVVAQKSSTAINEQLKAARKSFQMIDRKYREGMASQIEYIDARTTMTQVEVNRIVTIYENYIRWAELERVLGKEINYSYSNESI